MKLWRTLADGALQDLNLVSGGQIYRFDHFKAAEAAAMHRGVLSHRIVSSSPTSDFTSLDDEEDDEVSPALFTLWCGE